MNNIKSLYREYIEYRELKGLYIIKYNSFRNAINKYSLDYIKNSIRKSYKKIDAKKLYIEYLEKEKGYKLSLVSFKYCIYNKKMDINSIINRANIPKPPKIEPSYVFSAVSMYKAGYSIAFIARELNKNYTSVYVKIRKYI